MEDRKRILFIYLSPSSFVNTDREILKKEFEVIEFRFFSTTHNNLKIPFIWLSQFFWLIKHIKKAELIFGWFVDYHMLVPALFASWFKKPLAIVLGGTDTVNIPEINHGVFASSWRSPIARYIYQKADLLLPVSSTMVHSRNSFTYYPEEREFGIRKEVGDIRAKIVVIPTGYEPSFWELKNQKRKPIVTTVAFINSEKRIWIKGVDLFLEVAEQVPGATFQIVGVNKNNELFKDEELPANVLLKEGVSVEELVDVYNESSIYLQLSRLEGFPNVLCEAMMCGCIPVGSAVFGITEILEETGYLIDKAEPTIIVDLLKEILASEPEIDRNVYREQIISDFSLSKRKDNLFEVLSSLLK